MAAVERSIVIRAPVAKIFSYLIEPVNLVEIWPSLIEVGEVRQTPEGVGSSYRWVMKMAGMRFEGATEVVEFVRERRIVLRDGGGIKGTRTILFHPENEGTRLTFQSEYTLNVPMLGKLVESFVFKENEKETIRVLTNLKNRMEREKT